RAEASAHAVRRQIAIDPYAPDTIWSRTRTDDPVSYALTDPPIPVARDRLDVRRMDMRDIDLPDSTVDFAYSICAFEHIGTDPDFIRHLAEVRRVLKPEGGYVMTTELCLGAQSYPVEGNHAFSIEHLLRLCQAAGLEPEAVFDGSQSASGVNWPTTSPDELHPDPLHIGGLRLSPVIVREYGGIISTACCLVLKPGRIPSDATCRVIGLAETIERARHRAAAAVARRYQSWTRLNPAAFFADHRYP